MKRIVCMFFLVGLCGCSRVNETSSSMNGSGQPAVEEEDTNQHTLDCTNDADSMSLQSQGDHVEYQTQTFYMTFEELGIGEGMSSEDMMNAINSSLARSYDALQGVDAV